MPHTTNKAVVTHIWPYNQHFNPDAQPVSGERETDVWEELRELTFDDELRGKVVFATHVTDSPIGEDIVMEELLKGDFVHSRVQFWEPREVECKVHRHANPARLRKLVNGLDAVERLIETPAQPARNEVVKKNIAWNLGSKANAEDVIYRRREISALVLWEPCEDEHLTHLDKVVNNCPDLLIYIFHSECRADKYGVERDGSPKEASLWDTQSEMSDEKELQAVIEHVAHEGESTWIFGYAKHGKTWIWLCVVKALLTGEPLFNLPDLKVPKKSKRVIYLCPEATRTSLRRRLKVLGLMSHLYDPITNPEGRLYLRSLSKGAKLQLDDPKLFELTKGADIFIDTAVRYLEG